VTACAVTPDGRHVVSVSDDHTLKVWELGSGRAVATLAGHRFGELIPRGRSSRTRHGRSWLTIFIGSRFRRRYAHALAVAVTRVAILRTSGRFGFQVLEGVTHNDPQVTPVRPLLIPRPDRGSAAPLQS
jgi:hypothetical protein